MVEQSEETTLEVFQLSNQFVLEEKYVRHLPFCVLLMGVIATLTRKHILDKLPECGSQELCQIAWQIYDTRRAIRRR